MRKLRISSTLSSNLVLELNPDPSDPPSIDPKDAFLLLDPSSSSGAYANGQSATPAASSNLGLGNVTWLRKTEYISRDAASKQVTNDPLKQVQVAVDISRPAQLSDIEASFRAANDDFSLTTLRHPNNPKLTAVESFPVLPDADIWANQYDLFRFTERPGERPPDVEDERLDCAILRPMRTEYDSFLAYYLTKDDDSAVQMKDVREALAPYQVPDEQEDTLFQFVRDYETVKVEQEVPNEFLLVLHEGEGPKSLAELMASGGQSGGPPREKAAYYKNIERKMTLKKKRANVSSRLSSCISSSSHSLQNYEQYDDKWDVIRVKYAPMSVDEEEERQEALAEVADPMYLFNRDADGEIEVEDGGGGVPPTSGHTDDIFN